MTRGATMQVAAETIHASADWQSNLRFYTKSTTKKLIEIGQAFGFQMEPGVLNDHEELAELRWRLQDRIGKDNPCATRALTKLYFAYLSRGRAFLHEEHLITQLFEELRDRFGNIADSIAKVKSPQSRGGLVILDAETVNELMSEYHFLGYGRSDGHHVGLNCQDRGGGLLAVATFSPWDVGHATPILQQIGIAPAEVLVLSRLLSVPGEQRPTLSQFIAQLIRWVRREMPEIKMIATYCNPNAGHYGTVYRGANFLPLCTETHPFVPFAGNEYVSPRKFGELYDRDGAAKCGSTLRAGPIKPIPLLIYYYPVRLSGEQRRRIGVGHCIHPYPMDLPARPSAMRSAAA